jgi:hypothetical protein
MTLENVVGLPKLNGINESPRRSNDTSANSKFEGDLPQRLDTMTRAG